MGRVAAAQGSAREGLDCPKASGDRAGDRAGDREPDEYGYLVAVGQVETHFRGCHLLRVIRDVVSAASNDGFSRPNF